MKQIEPILPHYFLPGGPGAVIAVAHKAEIIYSEVFGFADIQRQEPLTTMSAFDLASVSKTFTATATALLYQRGLLKLDAPLSSFFPEFSIQTPHRPVLVQDLLWHTSGLIDYFQLNPPNMYSSLTPQSIRQQIIGHLPESIPGVGYDYSNTNYVLLAQIIELLSGRSYSEFVTSELLQPLKLDNSFVLGSIPTPPYRVHGYINQGYGEPRYEIDELDIAIVGDGGLFSTAEDLIRWQHALFSEEVVDRATLQLMSTRGHLDNGKQIDYGFGMMIEHLSNGCIWCGHTGGWIGSSTLVGHYLEKHTTVVVLANVTHAPVVHIAHQVLLQLL